MNGGPYYLADEQVGRVPGERPGAHRVDGKGGLGVEAQAKD